jgi:ribose-phosphate pyrophosphokinase
MKLFAPELGRRLGDAVAQALNCPLGTLEERAFEDGEFKIRPLESVRRERVFVVQSLNGEAAAGAPEKLMRLLVLIGALKDAGATEVTAVVPYLPFSRKDRRTQPRDPVTTRTVAQLFEAVGTDRVVTLDVHNPAAFQNAFRIEALALTALPLFVDRAAERLAGRPAVVVSPDSGGVKRAEAFRKALAERLEAAVPLAFAEKHRAKGEVTGEALVGPVEGKGVLILDDMIASGGTLVRAARACLDHGAVEARAMATHGLFAEGAAETLADPALASILVTDACGPPRLPEAMVADRLDVVPVGGFLAEAIRRIDGGGSIVDLLDGAAP